MESCSIENHVASHIDALPQSGIREFFANAQSMPHAISLGIGEPNFVTPEIIRIQAIESLKGERLGYTDNRGTEDLRKAIVSHIQDYFSVKYDPDHEVIVTVGVSEALDLALRAIINPGDKILYHEPSFVSYAPGIRLAHGIPLSVKTYEKDGFQLRAESIREAWREGCKAILMNFPNNPTGAEMDLDELQKIADFAKEKNLLVITDEIYSDILFEGEHHSVVSLKGMRERTLLLHGFSKGWAMTGFRLGFACGPEAIIKAMLKIHQYTIICASTVSQIAGVVALKKGREAMMQMRDEYKRRRDFFVDQMNRLGLTCHLPRGSFFVFPKIQSTGMSDLEFARGLLKQEGVVVVPGSVFGESGAGFIRVSIASSYENLVEGCKRIERYLRSL